MRGTRPETDRERERFPEMMARRRNERATVLRSIARYYDVPAVRGQRVRYNGAPGRILGASRAGFYIRVKLDSGEVVEPLHPTWKIEYIGADGAVISPGPWCPK